MVFRNRKGLPKSKLVILEIYLDVYAIYLKITECKMLPLVLDLCTYLQIINLYHN